ncbi:hypothetical protein EDC04DRAFT_2905095 [Pisolithus marmoratus]|nr:hypothetical protein EDC04DRAFT_2905095 [Pisolithus marmoratus]
MVLIDEEAVPLRIVLVSPASVSDSGEQVDPHLQYSSECAPPDHLHDVPTDTQPRETAEDTVLADVSPHSSTMHSTSRTCIPSTPPTSQPPLLSVVHPPYSSDPFSMTSAISSAPLNTTQPDPSEPHLGGDEPFEDLFDVIQPQPSRGPRPPLWHA